LRRGVSTGQRDEDSPSSRRRIDDGAGNVKLSHQCDRRLRRLATEGRPRAHATCVQGRKNRLIFAPLAGVFKLIEFRKN
jgi:hypothetical protein